MYLDVGDRICKPTEYSDVALGDVVVVNPGLVKVSKRTLVFPPLSLVSPSCNNQVESPAWIDGYRVNGKERITVVNGSIQVEGPLRVEEPRFLPGYTYQKLETRDSFLLAKECPGMVLVSVRGFALLTVEKREVYICTHELTPLLKALAYAALYYLSPSET